MLDIVDVLRDKTVEFGKRITPYVRLPWIEEQRLRQELAKVRTVAARVDKQFVELLFVLVDVLLMQHKFDEAEEILQRIIDEQDTRKQGPDDIVTSRALERLCSVYRTRYYRFFAGDFVLSSGLPSNHPTAMLESLIALCMSVAKRSSSSTSLSPPLSSFLDTIGRMLAWTGIETHAVRVMQLKMQALGSEASFSCCNICGHDIADPTAIYFCRLCEDMTICASCHGASTTSQGSSGHAQPNDAIRECFPHLVHVRRSDGERNGSNIATEINSLFPVVLDVVHSNKMPLLSRAMMKQATPLDLKSSTSMLFPADIAPKIAEGNEMPEEELLQNVTAIYELYKANTRDEQYSKNLNDLPDAKDVSTSTSFLSLLGIVSNARSTLEQRYRNGFGLHCMDPLSHGMIYPLATLFRSESYSGNMGRLDIATVLAQDEEDGLTDEQVDMFVKLVTCVVQLARGSNTNQDVTAYANDHEVIRTFNIVPEQLYEVLGGGLDAGQIRLLELLPGSAEDPIICRLINVMENDVPAFEALSYVWGTPKPAELVDIEINGERASITPNLHCALSILRTGVGTRVLWVDALCIHQADSIEKSNQVSNMAEIYRSASRVLIFLGDEPKMEPEKDAQTGSLLSFTDLFSFLNRDRDDEDEKGGGQWQEDDDETREARSRERFDAIIEKMGLNRDMLLKAFFDLCSREWWTRVWVLQEYSFPSTDPCIILGHFQTQAGRLRMDMGMLVVAHKRDFPKEYEQLKYKEKLYYPTHQANSVLSTYRFRDGDDVPYAAWMYPLLLSGHSWCTDRRDILYGRRLFLPDVIQRLFPPDYTLPVDRLYEQAAVWLLVFERGVEVFWDFPKRLSPQLPSWIPDFSQRRLMHEFDVKWEVNTDKLCFDPYVAIRGGEMALYGRPIDKVSAVYPVKASGHELMRRLWVLDMGFRELKARYPLWKRHPLHVKFPNMYSVKPLHNWCTGASSAKRATSFSTLLLDKYTRAFSRRSVDAIFSKAVNIVSSFHKAFLDKANEAESKTYETFLERYTHVISARNCAQQVHKLAEKLESVKKLVCSGKGTSDFLAPAFFDFEKLISSLHSLQSTQTSQPESREVDIDTTRTFAKLALEIMSETPDIINETESAPSQDDSGIKYLFPGLPTPTYSTVQSWATDGTCCDEEVELISTVLRRTASLLHSSWNVYSKTDNFDLSQYDVTIPEDLQNPVATLLPIMVRESQRSYYRKKNLLQACSLFEDRTFFVTQTGLVGVGSLGGSSVEVGDQVTMLDAAPFPMVLRSAANRLSSRNRHELIGYAQIQGLNPQEILELPRAWWPELCLYKII